MEQIVLMNFEANLQDIRLYGAIRDIQCGLPHSAYHLFIILEMHNPKSRTFFTPVSELGFTFHEMFEISLLSMEELSYEKMVLTTEELRQMKILDPQLHETYWKVICHLCIC